MLEEGAGRAAAPAEASSAWLNENNSVGVQGFHRTPI